ncbi:MAG: ribonuclease III [Novosphingobium sp.]|nr:ribonuclease III [Novosphingobium sp.]MCP5402372.1 ribonuclease III [Novosphingobium sp.]
MLPRETRAFLVRLTGYEIEDEELWLEAVTHGSTGNDRDYQRLEFLGDRVLGLAISEWLYERSEAAEGKLSQRLNALVSRSTCAQIARSVELGPHIRLGKQAKDDGGQDSDNILGDVMEALIGALFVELGFEAAREMVRNLWADAFAGQVGKSKHPKSALQEWAAGNRRKPPEYRLLDRSGPDHASQFTVSVSVKGVGEAEAAASSKQEAETLAAAEFLKRFT